MQPCAKDNPNRRKYARIDTDQVISFSHVDERELLGVSRDLSQGGIRFEAVGCEIALGDLLRVTFNVGDHTAVATGRVKWCTDMDPITMDVGIEFLDVEEDVVRLIEEFFAPEVSS
jgi:hypothetical protein